MRSWWKVLLSVVLVLPVGAYVTGSLVASADDDRAPRPVLRIDPPDGSPTGPAAPTRSPRTGPGDDLEVITPEYEDLDRRDDSGDDDHGGHGRAGAAGDDHSGDGSSGRGSGGHDGDDG